MSSYFRNCKIGKSEGNNKLREDLNLPNDFNFEWNEIPFFSVLTGKNGIGKTMGDG